MTFSERSESNLVGVHPDLIRLMRATDFPYPIVITEGLRDIKRQEELLKDGKSTTMNSRHLTGHAVDFAVFVNDKVTWEWPFYQQTADAIKATAKHLGIPITWGGDWSSFKDGTHIQLSWEAYPLKAQAKTPGNSKTVAAATVGIPIAAYIPEIFKEFKTLIGDLGAYGDDVIKYVQFALILGIAGYIVYERVQKIRREGV